jgi:hypothetical protein
MKQWLAVLVFVSVSAKITLAETIYYLKGNEAGGDLKSWSTLTNWTTDVDGGDVKIVSANAVNGLDVVFINGAGRLVIDLSVEDDDFAAYGIRNVKTDTPFAVEGDLDSITVLLDADAEPATAFERGVVTIKSDVYDTSAPLMKFVKSPFFRSGMFSMSGEITETELRLWLWFSQEPACFSKSVKL